MEWSITKTPTVAKWEYSVVFPDHTGPKHLESEFNKLGAKGWKLVTTFEVDGTLRFVFARPDDRGE